MTREEALAVVKKYRARMPVAEWDELAVALAIVVLDAADAAKTLHASDPKLFDSLMAAVSAT